MKKIVIITGLTASGKSGLALNIAKEFNGEIISADSVQIYKGLDIGSAKATKSEREEIKHHLIDIKNFDENYNVGEFIKDCEQAILDITSRGKLPIVVGGTGLYIKALISGYSLGEKSNLEFREKYQKLAEKYGNNYVHDILKNKNPIKANSVHPNNLKRVIRYLELEESGIDEVKMDSILTNFNVLALGIVDDREQIYRKINERVDHMMNLGLKEEVEQLIDSGATKDMQSMNSIGYKEWFDYFQNKTNLDDTVNLIKQHSRNYCKRQLTFLKTIPELKLCTLNEAKESIVEFLKERE